MTVIKLVTSFFFLYFQVDEVFKVEVKDSPHGLQPPEDRPSKKSGGTSNKVRIRLKLDRN